MARKCVVAPIGDKRLTEHAPNLFCQTVMLLLHIKSSTSPVHAFKYHCCRTCYMTPGRACNLQGTPLHRTGKLAEAKEFSSVNSLRTYLLMRYSTAQLPDVEEIFLLD